MGGDGIGSIARGSLGACRRGLLSCRALAGPLLAPATKREQGLQLGKAGHVSTSRIRSRVRSSASGSPEA